MLFLGHLGIGYKCASLFSKNLSKKWVFLGTVLPDLIDKPLYYGICWIYGTRGAENGLISCTRTLGHSGLFILLLCGISIFKGSTKTFACLIGVLTHLFLDIFGDRFDYFNNSSTIKALLFPVFNQKFHIMLAANIHTHAQHYASHKIYFLAELIGFIFLCHEYYLYKKSTRDFSH